MAVFVPKTTQTASYVCQCNSDSACVCAVLTMMLCLVQVFSLYVLQLEMFCDQDNDGQTVYVSGHNILRRVVVSRPVLRILVSVSRVVVSVLVSKLMVSVSKVLVSLTSLKFEFNGLNCADVPLTNYSLTD